MRTKLKKDLIFFIIIIGYYSIFFICKFTILENISLYPINYQLSETCIIVRGQSTTGPNIRVVEGEKHLLAAVPMPHPDDLNVKEIEMTGKSIFNDIWGYPDYYYCDWLIYGRVIGTTDKYIITGDGTIPVFETEKVFSIMSLSGFLTLEMILFAKPPWGVITVFFLYLWPVAAIPVYYTKIRK